MSDPSFRHDVPARVRTWALPVAAAGVLALAFVGAVAVSSPQSVEPTPSVVEPTRSVEPAGEPVEATTAAPSSAEPIPQAAGPHTPGGAWREREQAVVDGLWTDPEAGIAQINRVMDEIGGVRPLVPQAAPQRACTDALSLTTPAPPRGR